MLCKFRRVGRAAGNLLAGKMRKSPHIAVGPGTLDFEENLLIEKVVSSSMKE